LIGFFILETGIILQARNVFKYAISAPRTPARSASGSLCRLSFSTQAHRSLHFALFGRIPDILAMGVNYVRRNGLNQLVDLGQGVSEPVEVPRVEGYAQAFRADPIEQR